MTDSVQMNIKPLSWVCVCARVCPECVCACAQGVGMGSHPELLSALLLGKSWGKQKRWCFVSLFTMLKIKH